MSPIAALLAGCSSPAAYAAPADAGGVRALHMWRHCARPLHSAGRGHHPKRAVLITHAGD